MLDFDYESGISLGDLQGMVTKIRRKPGKTPPEHDDVMKAALKEKFGTYFLNMLKPEQYPEAMKIFEEIYNA